MSVMTAPVLTVPNSLRSCEKCIDREVETISEYVYWADQDCIQAIITSAKNGSAPAQFIVAASLDKAGHEELALCWYEKAARQGFKPALMKIGTDY